MQRLYDCVGGFCNGIITRMVDNQNSMDMVRHDDKTPYFDMRTMFWYIGPALAGNGTDVVFDELTINNFSKKWNPVPGADGYKIGTV
jgi:hypothetical protein